MSGTPTQIVEGFTDVPAAGSASRSRVLFLDYLRFIAAFAVLFQHAVENSGPAGRMLTAFLSPGVFGVVLFFMVSGFVIPMTVKIRLDIRRFLILRIFRIYPLLLFTLAAVFVVAKAGLFPQLNMITQLSPADWLANLLLMQDYVDAKSAWGVTWTLNLEIVWYCLFAVSSMAAGRRFDRVLAIAVPSLMLVLVAASLLSGHRLPLGRVGMIYAAVLGCRMYWNHQGALGNLQATCDIIAFITVMTICNVVSFGYFTHPSITMNQAVYPWIAAPLVFLLVRMRNTMFIGSGMFQFLGVISFSIYLMHPFAVYVAASLLSKMMYFPCVIVVTLALATFCYKFVEVPGQRLGRHIVNRWLIHDVA